MNYSCSIPNCPRTSTGCPWCDGPNTNAPYALPPQPVFYPPGCICPPTSEQTCRNPSCPRGGGRPLEIT